MSTPPNAVIDVAEGVAYRCGIGHVASNRERRAANRLGVVSPRHQRRCRAGQLRRRLRAKARAVAAPMAPPAPVMTAT